MSLGRRRPRSKVAAAVSAVRTARSTAGPTGEGRLGMGRATVEAVRRHRPSTLAGLVAHGGALMVFALVENRRRWVPWVTPAAVPAVVAPVLLVWPVPTVSVLAAVLVGTGALAVQENARYQERGVKHGWTGWQLGAAAETAGGLVLVGLWAAGVLSGMLWWQVTVAATALCLPGAVAWWRPTPGLPGAARDDTLAILPAAMKVARDVVVTTASMPTGQLAGARLVSLDSPAPRVAAATVRLPPAVHTQGLALDRVRHTVEALADALGREEPDLGPLEPGSVQVSPLGVSDLSIVFSWSQDLSRGPLAYAPPQDLPEGTVWLGRREDRTDVTFPLWRTGADGRTSCFHVRIVGATGTGKSVTMRALLLDGLRAGCILPVPLDAKGDSLDELAPLVPGGAVARDRDAWAAGIELVGRIMEARIRRQGTADAWRRPSPEDPLVTLIIDEAAMAAAALTQAHHMIVTAAARQGRSLGICTIQGSQQPLMDEWVGGSVWRSQARVGILHALREDLHAQVAARGLTEPLELTLMPPGHCALTVDSEVIAARARVALITEDDVRGITLKARLHPVDADHAHAALEAYVECVRTGSPGSSGSALSDALAALGTPEGRALELPAAPQDRVATATVQDVPAAEERQAVQVWGNPAPVPATGGVPERTATAAVPGLPGPDSGMSVREIVLDLLMVAEELPRRDALAAGLMKAGWSSRTSHQELAQMLHEGDVVEQDGRLATSLRLV